MKGELDIRCGEEDKYVFLEFSDNGGTEIAKEYEEEVFNAFYTTSSAAGT